MPDERFHGDVLTMRALEGRLTAKSGRRTLNGWLHGRRR